MAKPFKVQLTADQRTLLMSYQMLKKASEQKWPRTTIYKFKELEIAIKAKRADHAKVILRGLHEDGYAEALLQEVEKEWETR